MRAWLAVVMLPAAMAQTGAPLGTAASVARGDKLFAQGCAVGYCHGAGGSAARSQRLRGRTFEREYLIRVIRDGIPNTAMPAWGDRLTDADIRDIADYIQSLANAPAAVETGPAPAGAALPEGSEKVVEIPEEHRRGREQFFDLTRESRCSVCHRLGGIGVAVGPDVTKVSALKAPDAAQVLRYGRPRTVRTIVRKDGERFPGVIVSRTAALLRVYDLTSTPPVLRSMPAEEVGSILRGANWRHAAAVRSYTNDDLQAVWNYVRFAAEAK